MTRRRTTRQLIVGLLALPLSLLPFAAYLSWTPEGRLVRDRVLVAVNPPTLPRVSADEVRRGVVPAYRGAVMVLAYHGVGSATDGEGGFAVSPERFGEHLVALERAGMHAVTAAEVADAFAGGKPLPSRAVMITFDDGRNDAMMFADPLLEQAGMRATMFVITGAASEPGIYYAGWNRLEDAAKSGRWDLQSHTDAMHDSQRVGAASLPLMTSRAEGESLAEYRARIRADLTRADRALREHTGADPVAFAYPFGAYGADRANDPKIRDTLHTEVARRYALAFQQDEQDSIPLATPYDERTALRRLEVGDWTPAQLMRRIAAAAGRTADTLAQRQQDLATQVEQGAPVPTGLVEQPSVEPRVQRRASRARATTAQPTTAQPSPVVATYPAPVPPPPANNSSTGGSPPRADDPPTTWQPPTSPDEPGPTPPDPSPPSGGTDDDSPGRSGEPHGNGNGNGKGGGKK